MIVDQPASQPRGWPVFLAGFIVFLLAIISNIIQLAVFEITAMPWPMLIGIVAGVVLMASSLIVRFSLMRLLGAGVFLALAALAWFLLLLGGQTPDYTGPAQVGSAVPVFEVALADGKKFSDRDCAENEGTILLFNRGRW